MTNSLLKYLLVCSITLGSTVTIAQNTFKVTQASSIGYLEYLPKNYNNNSDKYPVVIFLHGLGERGPESNNYDKLKNGISAVEKNGPPKHVKQGTEFPFILISPQLKSNYGDWPTWYVNEVIDYCKTYLRIDERRIYLTGLSLGGGGTWNTAQDEPKLFAAIAPMCGSRNSTGKACLLADEDLPVWAFHGDADHTVGMSRTVNMVSAINSCNNAPNPRAKLTIYPGVKHNCWEKGYEVDHSVHNPNVYEWLLSFTNTRNGSNKIPLANAGADQTIAGNDITISGSGSDSDGNIESYLWEKVTGPSANLNVIRSSRLDVTGLNTGTYVFRLQVTDNDGDSDSDYVKVTVQSSGGNENASPVVNAGVDKVIALPTNSVLINGAASDPDGKIVEYEWTEVSGNSAKLSGEASPILNVSSLTSGAYVFRLTVKDNSGATKSDEITVTVAKATDNNTSPVADAGTDRIVKLPIDKITLFGLGSDKGRGKIVSYKWEKISGGQCTFSDNNVLRPTISKFTSGKYIFKLTVTDDDGNEDSDDLTIVFNSPPVADAGKNHDVSLAVTELILNGSGSDSDGTVKKYVWSKYSGPKAKLLNANTSKLKIKSLRKGTYVLRLTITDDIGLQGVDYATVKVVGSKERGRSLMATDSLQEDNLIDSLNVSASENQVSNHENDSFFVGQDEKLKNAILIIFDDYGRKIFEGQWHDTLYQETFNRRGLYIYHIIEQGRRITGKVYIN